MNSPAFWIGYVILIFAFMYFIAIRPQQKEKKKMQELMASIAVGDSVLTSSGFYGVIIDMTEAIRTAAFPCRSRPSSRLRSRRRKAEREPDTEKVVRLFLVWCGHRARVRACMV